MKLGVVGLSPWIWSKRWFVLNDRKLYYYKSPYVCCMRDYLRLYVHFVSDLQDMSAEGVVDMSGYSIRPAPELKMKK